MFTWVLIIVAGMGHRSFSVKGFDNETLCKKAGVHILSDKQVRGVHQQGIAKCFRIQLKKSNTTQEAAHKFLHGVSDE